jgi:hypothetical protein
LLAVEHHPLLFYLAARSAGAIKKRLIRKTSTRILTLYLRLILSKAWMNLHYHSSI